LSLSNWRHTLPRLKRLSGPEVVSILRKFGFEIISQRGSHIKLRRTGPAGQKKTLTIPNHSELDTGTCRAIVRQASRYVPTAELAAFFYTE
jgi:predicted RNA binding protein YcfA (HicA-like mRNA interferase family)